MAPAFQAFGAAHLGTLAIILGISLALPLAVNRMRSPPAAGRAGMGLGGLILACKLGELAWYVSQGVPWRWLLPFHLCDLAAFAAAAALVLRSPRIHEAAYFWGMAGTVQALLTPDLRSGFPNLDYWLFFVPHGLVVAGVGYATGALGLRPGPGSVGRAFLYTALACLPAGLANWRLGTNYMYLRAKPEAATLLDFMGPWPWYILVLVPVAWAFLEFWYLPFRWMDRRPRPGTGIIQDS
jgi:hypothetical integral membrane protein (TIGR02206 family)